MTHWKRRGQNEGAWVRDPSGVIAISTRVERGPSNMVNIAHKVQDAIAALRDPEREAYMQTEAFWREVWAS